MARPNDCLTLSTSANECTSSLRRNRKNLTIRALAGQMAGWFPPSNTRSEEPVPAVPDWQPAGKASKLGKG